MEFFDGSKYIVFTPSIYKEGSFMQKVTKNFKILAGSFYQEGGMNGKKENRVIV